MKTKAFIFFSLLICNLLPAQNVKLDIVPHFFGVRAGSLLLAMDISIHIDDMDSKSAFMLTPVLTSQEKKVLLPHIQLNGKQKQAEAAGIIFQCSFRFPADFGISAFDISIILNNALNNAIEACQKLKEQRGEATPEIEISSYCRNNMFFTVIRNSFDGVLSRDSSDFSLITRKDDLKWHGLGFQNIRKSAEKYLGSAEYEVKENQFILTVMLQKRSTEK